MTSPTSIPASHPCLTDAHKCDRSAGGICNATAHRARVPAHHGLADGRPHGGSADNEYVCACMEGYEEKTPHAPSYKVQQYLMTTASQSTATTPEPMHTQSRRPTL